MIKAGSCDRHRERPRRLILYEEISASLRLCVSPFLSVSESTSDGQLIADLPASSGRVFLSINPRRRCACHGLLICGPPDRSLRSAAGRVAGHQGFFQRGCAVVHPRVQPRGLIICFSGFFLIFTKFHYCRAK
jgi:hypothetical protein